jgi:hypothetical protein
MTDFSQRRGHLYLATSPSGKRYVGITVRGVEARWRDHIARLGTLWPDGYNLRAGGSQFAPHPESIAKQAEKLRGRKWSEERKAQHRQAMNRPEVKAACAAPHVGRKATAETRRKMSESHRANGRAYNTGMLGRHHSEETKQKMRDAALRRRAS